MKINDETILSVVLPAYQEEENLRVLLPRLVATLEGMEVAYEILVVDTSEPMDLTHEVCAQFSVRYMLRSGGNRYGDAIRSGIREAQGRYLIFMDADGSHTPEFIPKLFAWAEANDVVIASRYIDKGHTENTFMLVLMSRLLNITYSLVLGLPCKDVSNSFKIYHSAQLKSLNLLCNNFDVVEEILFKMKRANPGMKIKEIPYVFKKRMFGETKRNLFIFILTYVYTMIKLRFRG